MGGLDFDRRPFARPAEPEPKPPRPSGSPGTLILLIVIVAGGLIAWRYLNVTDFTRAPANDPSLQQIEKKLDVLQHQVDQLERRRKAHRLEPPAVVYGEEAPYVLSSGSLPRSVPVSRGSALQVSKPARSASAAVKPPSVLSEANRESGAGSKTSGPSSLQLSQSSQQEWQATANQLGDVVGQLAAQQNAIDQTQASLGQLSARLGQSDTSFEIQKRKSFQRVGPVRLRLERVDARNQRYTMRLLIGDQSIELKNRAVHEAVPFYTSDGAESFDLVVLEIGKDSVAGELAFPARTSGR